MATKKTTKQSVNRAKRVTKSKGSKVGRHQSRTVQYKSFRASTNNPPFFTFKITVQTVYWTILIAAIIFLQLWIIKEQTEASTQVFNQSVENSADF